MSCYVIAEAGTNHAHPDPAERIARAQSLIGAAQRAGANAVKFQAFFDGEELFCPLEGDEKRWPRWRDSELNEGVWLMLADAAGRRGIDLLLSVFQDRGIELLKRLKPRWVKVASRAASSFPYGKVEGFFLVSMKEPAPSRPLHSRLYCVPEYPTPLGKARWGTAFEGLSDHSGTVWPGLDAIFRGAKFLEVHFNIPDCDAGPDAPVCLTVDQLKLLCEARDAVAKMR